jgi:carbamoyl-phosphate synthase large subunit
MVNVMVTQTGGGVGQGILKQIIRDKKRCHYKIFAADSNYQAAGLYFEGVDKAIILPTIDRNYIHTLIIDITMNKIDILIPGGDIELTILSENKEYIESITKCKVLVLNQNIVELAIDKHKAYQWCENNGIAYPPNFPLNYPLIIKPRIGWASNDVFVVNNPKELECIHSYFRSRNVDVLTQNKISGREITVEVVKTKGKVNGIIMMEREIKKGTTYRCHVIKDVRVKKFVINVSKELDFDGALNMQLLDDGKELYLMEINSRFSGTTGIRNALGFNSIEQMINYTLKGIPIDEKRLNTFRNGRFLRFWHELEIS